MTVIDQIIEKANALSPGAQRQLLEAAKRLEQKDKNQDPGLEAWLAAMSEEAIRGWPKEDWSAERKAWKARQQSKADEAR